MAKQTNSHIQKKQKQTLASLRTPKPYIRPQIIAYTSGYHKRCCVRNRNTKAFTSFSGSFWSCVVE